MHRCTEGEENTKALAQRIETVHSELLKWVNATTRVRLSARQFDQYPRKGPS